MINFRKTEEQIEASSKITLARIELKKIKAQLPRNQYTIAEFTATWIGIILLGVIISLTLEDFIPKHIPADNRIERIKLILESCSQGTSRNAIALILAKAELNEQKQETLMVYRDRIIPQLTLTLADTNIKP